MTYKKHDQFSLNYILALLNNSAVYFKCVYKLLRRYFSPKSLFEASSAKLRDYGLTDEEIAVIKNPDWQSAEQAVLWAQEDGHHVLLITDDDYPPLLKEIASPPQLIFVEGDYKLLAKPQLAIVGSRNPTLTGRAIAYDFAKDLAQAGFVITSGFATGIDEASHEGALVGNGFTVAVMGTGLGQIYPRQHSALAKKIVASGGALISEFPLMAKGAPWHFPLRNRIISGLSLGTLVVEATVKSGSLITAKFAVEQGREVFAVPGSIYNPLARGCHFLISQGAKLVETAADICGEFDVNCQGLSPVVAGDKNAHDNKNKLDHSSQKLLECVGFEATPADVLIARTNFSAQQVSSLLTFLELQGYIKKTSSGYERVKR
jgi:DNA processing protein